MTGFLQSIITVGLFILILGALVVIHELGHFITARLAKVRVLEFGVGFPPRAKVLRNKGETVYTLNWLPIGGFVKLEGEDGDAADDPRSFSAQRLGTKLWILVAGVLMNLLLAFSIFTAIAWLATPLVGVTVPAIQPDSPASAAGLQPGDSIIAVDGVTYEFYGGVSPLDELRQRAGETVVLTVVRTNGAREDVSVTLRTRAQIDDQHGPLGVSRTETTPFQTYFFGEYTGHDLATAIQIGAQETVRALGLILGGLGALVSSIATDPTAPPPVSGPVGIATQIGDVFWNAGPILTLYVAAILSANLALVNILPFPPLDGGRMLMITLKRFFGSRISLRAEQLTYMVGFVFLFVFLIWITGFDIVRSLAGAGS
jgi:regulator of sigma E protease